ncbi:oligomeric complex COG6 [Auriculariales sp. MPI-PUGE-AT-0066]|nr:oligomeric complex COG6 [Auriculariales sp. MPI-PUGE-AT-0066]
MNDRPRPRVSSLRATSFAGLELWQTEVDADAITIIKTPTSASPSPSPSRSVSRMASTSSLPRVDAPKLASLGLPLGVTPALDRKTSSPNPTARNPVSLRLYKVLAANFEDEATRDALKTLSALYSDDISPDAAATSKSAAVLNAHAHGPVVSSGVAVRARKNLRRDVEVRLSECSQQFLRAFGEVDEKLDILSSHVDDMRARCDEIQAQLQASNDACKYLLERAHGLQEQRETLNERASLVTSFLQRFTLTDEEMDAILSRDIAVGKKLFNAMDRAERIRDDCRVLLSGEGGDSQAGLDIMAMTAQMLEQAHQKLFRWCSFEFRQLGRDALLEVSPTMRETVRRLRAQPTLLSEALQVLSSVRQTTLSNAFVEALTRGGPGGMPRPIELHAHDPVRYVGDMLAWVHQTTAGEQEFLDALFGVKHQTHRMMGAVRTAGETEEEGYVRQLMDEDLEKLCLPLKGRVQQTTRSQEGSITSYKIANLLQFYLQTMQRTIGEQAILSKTVQEITDSAFKVFFDTLEAQGRSLLRFLHPPESDLGTPLSLRDFSHVLREIMDDYRRSLLGDETLEQEREGFNRILGIALEPALEMCKRMADLMPNPNGQPRPTTPDGERKTILGWEQNVFLVNCYVYLQAMLDPYEFTHDRVGALEQIIEGHVASLKDDHYLRLLKDSGLAPVTNALTNSKPDEPLAHNVSASPQNLTTALRAFDRFLSTLDVASSPLLALLSVGHVALRVHRGALARVAQAYERLCEAVRDSNNRYEFASTLLGGQRPFGQMGVLWQVLGIQEDEVEELAK